MKEGFNFGTAAEQISLLFTVALATGRLMATQPLLVAAGCLLYLALDKFVDRVRQG